MAASSRSAACRAGPARSSRSGATAGPAGQHVPREPAAASAHSGAHTLKSTAVTNKIVKFTKTTYGVQESDVNSAGKTIGFDDGYIPFTGRTTFNVNAAIDTTGGFRYVRFASANGGKTVKGKVTGGTGGTGTFKGATGTITGKAITSTKTAVTIIYS